MSISPHGQQSAAVASEQAATRDFKSMRTGRVIAVAIVIALLAAAIMASLMTWFPSANEVLVITIFVLATLCFIALAFFVIVPKWCSDSESITFRKSSFHSKLHGDVPCKDITSSALSTFSGSDQSIRIITKTKAIRYNFRPLDGSTHAWVSGQLTRMIGNFNADAQFSRELALNKETVDDSAPEPSESAIERIEETSVLKGPFAVAIVVTGFLASTLMIFSSHVGPSRFGVAALTFGGSVALLSMIIRARGRG